jgi:hypothetical protein
MASFVWMLPTEPTYNRTLFWALAWRARNLSQKTPPTVSVFPLTGYGVDEVSRRHASRC